MILEAGDIVTIDHCNKRRMGIVLETDVIPGTAIVAVGYGVMNRHDDYVTISPNTQNGRCLRIYKKTSFYAQRTYFFSFESIYPTGRRVPESLLSKLKPFVSQAIRNNYIEVHKPERQKPLSYSTGSFGITLGDLLRGRDD